MNIKNELLDKSSIKMKDVIALLNDLISIPSFSKEEEKTADLIEYYLSRHSVVVKRLKNNIWAYYHYHDSKKPTILLNSHHDTVKPKANWNSPPFEPIETEGKIIGLGSNDAGASLVSLLETFLYFLNQELPFNLVFAASAEEEISGKNGMELLVGQLGKIDLAIVGEPTGMDMAISEKGLMVVDCSANGVAGHAAREEGVNAIYNAIEDINWINNYQFEKTSKTLGGVKMSVTVIEAGSQHNVVPNKCNFTIDIRTTDQYSNKEVLELLNINLKSDVKARSTRLNPSGIGNDHPILKIVDNLNIKTYGSPTLSDQALMPWPSVKIGPGDSARSHTADEHIYLSEIENGIEIYKEIINQLKHETLG